MGYVSVEQGDHLFWLGRYVERVCLTLHYLEELYDVLLDSDSSAYKQFCDRLNIPNVYADEMDFITHYQWDKNNPDSFVQQSLQSVRQRFSSEKYHLNACSFLYPDVLGLNGRRGKRAPTLY